MYSKIHELTFHEKQAPIYAITYTSEYIITGGADLKIMVWSHTFDYVATLSRHQTPVMILRSLNESHFISASDDGHCIIWQKSVDVDQAFVPCHSYMKSQTIADVRVFEPFVVIATISTIYIHQYQDLIHKIDFTGKLIQGIGLDPIDKIISVQFSDGGIRHLIPKSSKKYTEIKVSKLCVGDFNRIIFRKCEWLPDGSGCLMASGYSQKMNSCLLFGRKLLQDPICAFATPLKQTTCIVVYPIPMNLITASSSLLGLPYRYIFCVLSTNGLQLWDTEHHKPIFTAKGFHYAHLTDAVFIASRFHIWKGNQSKSEMVKLIIGSADGFISEFQFEAEELGVVYDINTNECADASSKAWNNPEFDCSRFAKAKQKPVVMQIKKKNEKGEMVVIK
eukprot:NODE_94_length_21515_cov_0.130417.p6 type:complete len:392 gc:universal NODE_94_length_21515_cov_0.130417:6664-5489(-)